MKTTKTLREPGKLHLGTWLSIGSPVITELAAESGFAWLLLDLEHGATTEATLLQNLQAIHSETQAIVRVGKPHPDLVGRVLDWGAQGIMFPHISTVAEAEECVRAAYYPPKGNRGVSRSVRAYRYGLEPFEAHAHEPLLIAQIETFEGVRNAKDIAQVEGIDVLFVGPADLQFDLQTRMNESSPDYSSCLKIVAQAAAEAGKVAGILIRDPRDTPSLLGLGYTFVAIGSDSSILLNGYKQILCSIDAPKKSQ